MKKTQKPRAASNTFYFLFSVFSGKGFTIIELLMSIGIVVFLAIFAITFIDPTAKLAESRNNERRSHLELILNAVGQNIFDNKGAFSCSNGTIPSSTIRMATGTGNYNIGPCLIPNYLNAIPIDPSTSGVAYIDENNYNTGYFIIRNATTGRVTVSAPAAELGKTIEVTR